VAPVAAAELVKASGTPFGASVEWSQAKGYVEAEFYLRGLANRYRIADVLANAQVIDSGHPFVTRALVRRPSSAAHFNGVVIVEWLNVSTGQDLDFVYAATRELLVRDGYAWVGVSVQSKGIDALKHWNPARYSSLNVSESNVDPLNGQDVDPPNLSAPSPGDVLGWDIYSQVGAAVRDRSSPLMGGLKVKRAIAAGESQSSFRLSYYFNSIQPLHHVYNGFLLYDRGGPFPLRSDVDAKVVSVGSEFMTALIGSPQVDTANQRWWEVAGAAHVSVAEIDAYVDPLVRRSGVLTVNGAAAGISAVLLSTGTCATTPLWSRVPNADIMKAALKSLNTWVAGGAAPAMVPRLAVDEQKQLVRDPQGGTLGGIRTAAYDAPTATNVGPNAKGPCMLAGYHLDFSAHQMCQRYGSQAAYVAKVRALTAVNVRDGVLLPEEARKTINEAKAFRFSCGGE
jgi:hypothetical protein